MCTESIYRDQDLDVRVAEREEARAGGSGEPRRRSAWDATPLCSGNRTTRRSPAPGTSASGTTRNQTPLPRNCQPI